MAREDLGALAARVLDAWTSQDVERVVACYTDDVVYRDPNTRGEVRGRDAFRRYLRRLFQAWVMTWSVREVRPLEGGDGCALLWRATFRRAGGADTVEADGMDLVLLRGDAIARNEVWFDRVALASLAGLATGARS